MNDEQRRRHERFNRVRTFCEELPEPFAAGSRGALALASLDAGIEQCEELDASQSTHISEAGQGTSRRRELRKRLREQLSAMNKTVRAIGKDNPSVRDKFKLEASRGNDQALLSTARAFLAEATPIKALFLEYDMSANFLETLSATINDFEQAVNQQNTGAGGRTQARAGIDEIQARMNVDFNKVDTVIRNKFHDDAAMLAAWESASRLERAPKASKKGGNGQEDNTTGGA